MTAAELASLVGGRVVGDEGARVSGVASLASAGEGELAFVEDEKFYAAARASGASVVIAPEGAGLEGLRSVVETARPKLAFALAAAALRPTRRREASIHPTASVARGAVLGEGVHVGAHVSVGEGSTIGEGAQLLDGVRVGARVTVGRDCVLHPNVVLYDGVSLGDRVVLHACVVVGADGFGYVRDSEGVYHKFPQVGTVVIEDDVEIGAGSCVDRGALGATRVGRGAKIDNLVQVGHSCTVGEDTLLCAQVGLAGSSHVGARVILAGQVGVAGHLKVGDDAVITAKSATSHDVPPGKVISGIPAFDNREWLRSTAAFRRLGEMQRSLRALEQRLASLEKSSPPTEERSESD
jgi:UDP-3-O-[3-hydroxymyristoyl] glucosamine N-acyltransferase